MNQALVGACWGHLNSVSFSDDFHQVRELLAKSHNHAITFTHGGLHQANITVNNGHVVAILDWERAGWFPEYWESASAVTNCSFFRDGWGQVILQSVPMPLYFDEELIHWSLRIVLNVTENM